MSNRDFIDLHERYVDRLQPLLVSANLAWWEATTEGSDGAFARKQAAEEAMVELHSDRQTFAELERMRRGDAVTEPVLRRQLDVMFRTFVPGRADPDLQKQIVALENEVEQAFNTHRSRVDGQALTENEVREVLVRSTDSPVVERAWRAYMQVGAEVEDRFRTIVSLRNQLAHGLGYPDYYQMQLELQEIDPTELVRLFDELDTLTRAPFAALKADIDAAMAERFQLEPSAIRPWHYGDLFFQEAPALETLSLDHLFETRDMLALATAYYDGLGMDVRGILGRSDLYEKPGKSPHAFATDIDRAGDVRILCNLRPSARWMDTLLHELGHAVYDLHIDRHAPFLLREASNTVTTEGIAMMMGAMAKKEEFLDQVLQVPVSEARALGRSARHALRAEKLTFSRWAQVMVRFERALYADPAQDLGALWWDLKRQYQLQQPPDGTSRPDYAAKIHVALFPVYYHGYMMGDLFSSQVQHHISAHIVGHGDPRTSCFHGQAAAGQFLREEIFAPGTRYPWPELTRRATGEPLVATHFARQYVEA